MLGGRIIRSLGSML